MCSFVACLNRKPRRNSTFGVQSDSEDDADSYSDSDSNVDSESLASSSSEDSFCYASDSEVPAPIPYVMPHPLMVSNLSCFCNSGNPNGVLGVLQSNVT